MSPDGTAWFYQFRALFGFDPSRIGITDYAAATEYCYKHKPEMYPKRAAIEAAALASRKATEVPAESKVVAVVVSISHALPRKRAKETKPRMPRDMWYECYGTCGKGDSGSESYHFSSDEYDVEEIASMACDEVDEYWDIGWQPVLIGKLKQTYNQRSLKWQQ